MLTYLFIATLYVGGRVSWYANDRPRRWPWLLIVSGLQGLAVMTATESPSWWYLAVGAAMIVLAVTSATVEALLRRGEDQNNPREGTFLACRLSGLVVGLVVLGILASTSVARIEVEIPWVAPQSAVGILIAKINWLVLWSYVLGVILCFSEAGTIVRLLLRLMSVKKPASVSIQHSAEIGCIERLLVFIFVLNGAFNAVAFILTAKAVARLHETAEPDAAEYVLIGTLVSTLTAIGTGLLVTHLV